MFITIDTSVLIAVVAHEQGRTQALNLTVGKSLVAPQSVHWEMGNAFSAMIKRSRVSLGDATTCLKAYAEIPLRLVEVDLVQALAIVEAHRIYAYDAYLLACAIRFASPLLTLDKALQKLAGSMGIKVLEI